MWGMPSTDLRYMQDMGILNPSTVGQYPELDLLRYPYLNNKTPSAMPAAGGSNWMDYAGLGMMGAAPVANALLSKDTSAKYAPYAGGTSLGGKPMMQSESPYRMPRPMPAFLARLLMGAR